MTLLSPQMKSMAPQMQEMQEMMVGGTMQAQMQQMHQTMSGMMQQVVLICWKSKQK